MPLVVLGYSVGVWGSNMLHTAVNLLKTPWAPSNSWNFIQYSHHSFRSVLLSLSKTFTSHWHQVYKTVPVIQWKIIGQTVVVVSNT